MNISSKAKYRNRCCRSNSRDGTNAKAETQERKSKPTVPPSPEANNAGVKNERARQSKLQFLLKAINKLDDVFEDVECYGQEIPCIRSVRELGRRLKIQLDNDYGTFNRVLGELKEAEVCVASRIVTRVEKLQSLVREIVNDDANYIQNLEGVRQCLGEISGLVETILNVEQLTRRGDN